jgi:hypothetical protein
MEFTEINECLEQLPQGQLLKINSKGQTLTGYLRHHKLFTQGENIWLFEEIQGSPTQVLQSTVKGEDITSIQKDEIQFTAH